MTRQQLIDQIAVLQKQENDARILAERAAGARQAYEHLLKVMPDPVPVKAPADVREFPSAVSDATGSA